MSGEMDKHLLKEAAAAFATDGEAKSAASATAAATSMIPSVSYVRNILIFFRG